MEFESPALICDVILSLRGVVLLEEKKAQHCKRGIQLPGDMHAALPHNCKDSWDHSNLSSQEEKHVAI